MRHLLINEWLYRLPLERLNNTLLSPIFKYYTDQVLHFILRLYISETSRIGVNSYQLGQNFFLFGMNLLVTLLSKLYWHLSALGEYNFVI